MPHEKREPGCVHPFLQEQAPLRTGFSVAVHSRPIPAYAVGLIFYFGQLAVNKNVTEIQEHFKSLLW